MELDPEIRGFLHDTDQMFGADYAALPLSGQRRVDADWCARYEPAPAGDVLGEDAADFAKTLKGAGIAVEHRVAAALTHSYLRCIHLSLAAYQEFEALCNALRALAAAPAATDAA